MRVGLDDSLPPEPFLGTWQMLQRNAPCLNISWIPTEVWKNPAYSYTNNIIKSGEIDTLSSFWTITDERMEVVNFSRLLVQSKRVFVVPDAKRMIYPWYIPNSTVDVFSPSLWAVAGFVISVIVVGHVLSPPANRHLPSVWRWFAFYMQGGSYDAPIQHVPSSGNAMIAVKLICFITGLFTMHSMQLYQVGMQE